MDIFPFFDRPQLGLKLALLSPRFDVLVDAHFDGKNELTIWRRIRIHKDEGPKPKLSEWVDGKYVEFPLSDRPLYNKIRFNGLQIEHIDHSVIAFLRSNQQIWDRGSNLLLYISSHDFDDQLIWNVLVRQILPIFVKTNIRHLRIDSSDHLDSLRRVISSTFLTDLNINSIESNYMLPEVISDFDGPTVTSSAGQELSKWLHTPRKDGQPKQLFSYGFLESPNFEWVNNFKEVFVCAHTSVCYTIYFNNFHAPVPIVPFELMNRAAISSEKTFFFCSIDLKKGAQKTHFCIKIFSFGRHFSSLEITILAFCHLK